MDLSKWLKTIVCRKRIWRKSFIACEFIFVSISSVLLCIFGVMFLLENSLISYIFGALFLFSCLMSILVIVYKAARIKIANKTFAKIKFYALKVEEKTIKALDVNDLQAISRLVVVFKRFAFGKNLEANFFDFMNMWPCEKNMSIDDYFSFFEKNIHSSQDDLQKLCPLVVKTNNLISKKRGLAAGVACSVMMLSFYIVILSCIFIGLKSDGIEKNEGIVICVFVCLLIIGDIVVFSISIAQIFNFNHNFVLLAILSIIFNGFIGIICAAFLLHFYLTNNKKQQVIAI